MRPTVGYTLIGLARIFADLPLLWMFYFLHFQPEGEGGSSDAALNALLFISFGLLHSLLARNFSKKYLEKVLKRNLLRISYVTISSVTLLLLLYLWRPISGILWQTEGVMYWLLTLLYLGSVVGMVYSAQFIDYLDFLGLRTFLRKIKGKPFKPPVFSVKGPYAYCRHPMYLLLLFAFWFAPVMTYVRLEFALLGSLYLIVGTLFEERNLREELGDVYDLYRANVPMWVPRLTPWTYEPSRVTTAPLEKQFDNEDKVIV